MTEIPSLLELQHVVAVASTRLFHLDDPASCDLCGGDLDPPTEWEWSAVKKADTWLKELTAMTPEQEVELAKVTLAKHGYGVIKTPPEVGVERAVWLSTAHIDEFTNDWLADHCNAWCFVSIDAGFMIRVAAGSDFTDPPGPLGDLLNYAVNNGFELLFIHAAESILEGLPTYDW